MTGPEYDEYFESLTWREQNDILADNADAIIHVRREKRRPVKKKRERKPKPVTLITVLTLLLWLVFGVPWYFGVPLAFVLAFLRYSKGNP